MPASPKQVVSPVSSFPRSRVSMPGRPLSYPLMRLTVGGILLIHGIVKVTGPGLAGVAASLARRGMEPSLPFASLVIFNETIGAICVILGLFTRPIAASLAIEFFVITFFAHFNNGFFFSSPGGAGNIP